jgi:hypothetical protein
MRRKLQRIGGVIVGHCNGGGVERAEILPAHRALRYTTNVGDCEPKDDEGARGPFAAQCATTISR